MTVHCERLTGEPIIIVTVTDPVDIATDPFTAYHCTTALGNHIPGTIHRITDFSCAQMSVFDVLQGISRDRAIAGLRIRGYLVGSQRFVEIAARAINGMDLGGSSEVLIYADLADALASARAEIHKTVDQRIQQV